MTSYDKWDKFVAELSDDDDDCAQIEPEQIEREPELPKPGVGKELSATGKIQPSGNRPGNARGNALSTNADYNFEFEINSFSWNEDSEPGNVIIEIPLTPIGQVLQEKVHFNFSEQSFQLSVQNEAKQTYRLVVAKFPAGGIIPSACSGEVRCAGGKTQTSSNKILVRLRKLQPDVIWGRLGDVAKEKKRPVITINDYSWSDGKQTCTIYIKVPEVHLLPQKQVKARFRELSFDLTVEDLNGKDYMFAITEFPMEVVVDECKYEVRENEVKIVLRKWAKTGWFKLTNLNGR
ncbi:hypothetical protein CYMTET_56928 [Cymbomonas tetramitiformis]|uniref:CS domain-containing protein n=1 Tax=Cymbomonas tetramitiformis TaxID=36881 RepID=A0AAE0BB84_9CHLO|nr:hypothetical protein CYMTET_56928 [Cymbomonas tetramitiformis]